MNIKVRLRNKAWLLTAVPVMVAAIYNVLALFDIVPCVTQDMVTQLLTTVVNLLAVVGVVIDPTTHGLGDSARAMQYEYPYRDSGNVTVKK